ncbi:MAG: restriction endonuclease [Dermatophilaceae bacterium]
MVVYVETCRVGYGSGNHMARRRSFVEHLIAESLRARIRKKRAQERSRARAAREAQAQERARQRAAAAEERRVAAAERQRSQLAEKARRAEDRAVSAARREQERTASQQRRDVERAVADQRQREKAAERAAAAEAARRRRAHAEHARAEREQAKVQRERAKTRLHQSATTKTEEAAHRLRRLAGILYDRPHQPLVSPRALEAAFNQHGPNEFCARLQTALSASPLPPDVPARIDVLDYRPEARELVIERELSPLSIIPVAKEYRVIKQELREVPHKAAERQHLYGQLLARTALRTLAEAFAATPSTLVGGIVLSGRVTSVDRATGKPVTPHLLSVQFARDAFEDLRLDAPELDPELCLRAQNALISPHPHDLVPVKPLLYYDLDRYKTIAESELAVDLDSRLDLLTLSATEFETLIRQLFEARGLKSWQTQSSRDDGVDAVVVNEDVVLGGLAIIQAKRYRKIVPYEAVTALAGVMHHKNAAKGILVTTSWVGNKSREFANDNGRIQIIEGRELKHLLAEYLNMDVLISLPVVPRGWERSQIA